MIYLERTITIKKGSALIDEQIILYKGDRNVEIQFFLKNNPYKTKTGLTISYGQLVIKREAGSIFSEVSKVSNNKVLFVITEDMIDELCECGDYDFQIRLFNEDQSSRASLPPIEAGITIKQPICEEGVNAAVVNKIKATSGESLDVFDAEGNYNKTIWTAGDLITDSKLNKIEDAIYEINENVPNDYVTDEELNAALKDIDVDLTGYASEQYVQDAIKDIEISGGDIDLTGYATEEYVGKALDKYATKEDVNNIITVIDKIDIGFDDLPDGSYACYLKGSLIIKDLNGNKLTSTGECGYEIVQIYKINTDTTKKVYVYTMENKYFEIDIISGTAKKSIYDVSKEYMNQQINSAVSTINQQIGDIERLLGGI